MTLIDFIEILQAVKDEKPVKMGYQLHNKLESLIEFLGGPDKAFEFFVDLSQSEPGEFPK